MKYLHIMNNDKKFIPNYIKTIENNFKFQEHHFIIFSQNNNDYYKKHNNIYLIDKKKKYFNLEKKLYKAEKIILHSLFNRNVIMILFLQPWLLKKSKWVLWGADLYNYRREKKKIKHKLLEFMRGKVIKNLEGVITYIKGDYELTQEWYNTKANYYESMMYLSNSPSYNIDEKELKVKIKEHTFIQIGNSADSRNNHIKILDVINKFNNKYNRKIKIICPLSYGNEKYAKRVIDYGKSLFGKDFVPLTKFMDLKTYNKLQSNIDIAIFNHKRQQAMGNILTLLYLGKKVYIRDDITTWDFMKKIDIKVFSFNNYNNNLLEKIDPEVAKQNREKIDSRFNIDLFIEEWTNIFNS
ncbi:TDP-N-acetylfucosamine:lipid II N-acetylfucosaminyltransferase [Halanaerobium congolense]|uniref:4-alpha-L-fucosyltransferase glycosyl transferase group 56 n=1 Tax=Halanaerobium congolense TaxID=54121 RepID=A0A1G6SRG1_9FIRM|nr:TDP-N-acetylfucosamine:lipid II N-acetylfucosaminyltransferase [Halanaerobium congolense]SDD19221.1 4-alpha-L-fucosyltransferase glycosyl transferase group 56 [Halanaerobium congolense]